MSVNLYSGIKTCKTEAGQANVMFSNRFLSPDHMVCPAWDGTDSLGREVCKDSFTTRTAGCTSALDAVEAENQIRPPYYLLTGVNDNASKQARSAYQQLATLQDVIGRTGQPIGATIIPSCNRDGDVVTEFYKSMRDRRR